jgi:hypothetical protein
LVLYANDGHDSIISMAVILIVAGRRAESVLGDSLVENTAISNSSAISLGRTAETKGECDSRAYTLSGGKDGDISTSNRGSISSLPRRVLSGIVLVVSTSQRWSLHRREGQVS